MKYLSECCGYKWVEETEIFDALGTHGFCGKCHEWADFKDEDKRELSEEELEDIRERDDFPNFGD